MDPENIGKEAMIRVANWVNKIRKMQHRGGPIQQWVDSIATPTKPIDIQINCGDHSLTPPQTPEHSKDLLYSNNSAMTVSPQIPALNSSASKVTNNLSPGPHSRLVRDPSLQSDSSHCSSVESLLELRRADPEAILLGLGFGGCPKISQDNGPLSRIPKRFLQPSKLKGIVIDDFVKQQQETTESIDSTSLGYRGLTGSPYIAPSEIVQKIMERLREHESHELDAYTAYNSEMFTTNPVQQSGLSVLSPDNRQFLDRQRSKSPDISNKRMIIGKKSFAFSCDGDLIEINNPPSGETQDYRERLMNRFCSTPLHNSKSESIDEQGRISPQVLPSNDIHPWNSWFETPGPSTVDTSCGCRSLNKEFLLDNFEPNDDRDGSPCAMETAASLLDVSNSNVKTDGILSDPMDSFRRASDSSCESQSMHTSNEERRSSDGTINVNADRSNGKKSRRTLHRQTRIKESDHVDPLDSEYPNSLNLNKPTNWDDLASQTQQEISDVQTSVATSYTKSGTSSKKKTFCDPSKRHICCKSENMERICRHADNCEECCYYKSTINCWQKMHRLIKENEKLGNMVAKSRQEMLSSVLSARMEPGF